MAWLFGWRSAVADEVCTGTDAADGDGLPGCTDPDCWAYPDCR